MGFQRHAHLEVNDRQALSVRLADNAVQVLELGGQERPEGSLEAHGPCLLEAEEVGPADPSHVARLGRVQGDEVELEREEEKV